MWNFTLKAHRFLIFVLAVILFLIASPISAQLCGTPGGDGPVTLSSSLNTYYPVAGDITLMLVLNTFWKDIRVTILTRVWFFVEFIVMPNEYLIINVV
ncbi:hypothetical protein E0I26_16230 [Flavobacterium rhamnosiphilum]|uniref:Uncharacterized protein n=1 Tax=Flavobacterium rhamnosiphilum TaxID=2541724 RepID=A0A4R5F209_9FLAO|nr:hypothetical protein [Flavobacterium rhamnosiphilum]TDE41578.1 hypothetical protein E0I26_16230 [Flavobacterium rhamnosiphilum]